MYGLEVRIGSARGLVSVPAYRGLLDEVRALLTQVDQQARVSPDGQPWGVMGEPVEWGVRHEQSLTGLTLRVEPFDIAADGQRVLRAVQAVVRGVRELGAQPVIPPYYSEDAVSRLAMVAGRRGSNGIDRLDLAAVNGQVLDQVEVSEAVRQNARESVRAATTGTSTVEGVVDALAGGAKNKLRAIIYDPQTRRAVKVQLQPEQAEEFRQAWGRRVAVRGLVTYNRHGQPIRIRASEVLDLGPPTPRHELAELVGVAPGWTDGRGVAEVMQELRRRA